MRPRGVRCRDVSGVSILADAAAKHLLSFSIVHRTLENTTESQSSSRSSAKPCSKPFSKNSTAVCCCPAASSSKTSGRKVEASSSGYFSLSGVKIVRPSAKRLPARSALRQVVNKYSAASARLGVGESGLKSLVNSLHSGLVMMRSLRRRLAKVTNMSLWSPP